MWAATTDPHLHQRTWSRTAVADGPSSRTRCGLRESTAHPRESGKTRPWPIHSIVLINLYRPSTLRSCRRPCRRA